VIGAIGDASGEIRESIDRIKAAGACESSTGTAIPTWNRPFDHRQEPKKAISIDRILDGIDIRWPSHPRIWALTRGVPLAGRHTSKALGFPWLSAKPLNSGVSSPFPRPA